MTVTHLSNGIRVSDMINGLYVQRIYIGYTASEAQKEFEQDYHGRTN